MAARGIGFIVPLDESDGVCGSAGQVATPWPRTAYLAEGQILVYRRDGKLVGSIDVPERPIDLIFGGADRRTLYILTHASLYAVETRNAGL